MTEVTIKKTSAADVDAKLSSFERNLLTAIADHIESEIMAERARYEKLIREAAAEQRAFAREEAEQVATSTRRLIDNRLPEPERPRSALGVQ